MESLIDPRSLQGILERGLITGKWSIAQFNRRDYWNEITPKHPKQHIFPSSEFLKANPQFLDQNFRDLPAFERANHRKVI